MKLGIALVILIVFVFTFTSVAYSSETQIIEKGNLNLITTGERDDIENEILLKSRKFIPARGISKEVEEKIKARVPERTHVLLQFDYIPSKAERKNLEGNGIELLSYIPNRAWFASIRSERPEEIAAFPSVRAIIEILPEDKISPAVKNKNYIKNEDGTINLSVMFFNDVNLDDASSLMENYGDAVDKFYSVNIVKIITEESFILDIAGKESVQWIDVIDKVLQMHNDGNRENVGVNILQASPYSLSGINVVTAEWDGGWVDTTHDDLQGRVIIGDTGSSTGNHATHVAGTMLGNGTLSEAEGGTALQWRGMAPQATVISYEWWDDSTELNDEYDDAINTYDVSLSQNSWGYEYVDCGSDCFGGYDGYAAELDGIVRGSKGKRISQIWSAGNERPSDCDDTNYDCIGLPGTAKNVITVGATDSDTDAMTYFSSWGPTNDGRLKPEVTAPGCEDNTNRDDSNPSKTIWSSVPTDTYTGMCGTSMSAPTTSGVIALMLEEFANKGYFPLPSTIKAILIHTAKDLGNAGPDYSFGYGRINATAAIDKINEDSGTTNVIVKDDISQGETDEFNMTVPEGESSVKVTLVWDDYPAAANADPALVNHLDIVLIAPNEAVYYPWVLDPNNPANAATTGTNILDNVEQVYVTNPQAGIWKVKVNGSSVPYGPQKFSLVSDHSFTIQPSVTVKTFRDSYTTEDKFFDLGDVVYIQANVTAGGEALEGNTVTADLILSDGSVEDSLTLTEIGNGIYRNSWDSTSHTIDVYLVNVSVTGEVEGNGKSYFHLYSGSGISAYKMDWNNDDDKDYVLENLHLIAAFDGENATDQSLLYIEQKDTNVSYDFASISDSDTIGRGEITTTNMKDIDFFSFSITEGENLQSAELKMKIKIDDPDSFLCPDGDNECQVTNGFFYKNGDTPIECTSTYLSDDGSQNTDCSFSTQQDGGRGAFMHCEYDVSGIPEGSTLDDITTHINMEVNLQNAETSGTFELQYFDCSTASWVSGQTITYLGGGGEIDFYSNNYASTFSWWDQCSGTFKFRWFLTTNWVGPTGYDYLDMCSLRVGYTSPSITTLLNATIQMNSENVDYLAYKLHNFDQNISDINDIFPVISGFFDSVNDDRYHLQDGSDGLITSLTANQWNNYNSNYTIIYDNSIASDSINNNVVAFIRFNEAAGVKFEGSGLWYDNSYSTEGLRIRYNTSSASTSDEINYLLAFTKGDWQTIDQWQATIESGQYPSPNFMTPPSAEIISITLSGYPIDFSSLDPGTNDNPATGNSLNQYNITINPETTVNVDLYQKGYDFINGGSVFGVGNMTWSTTNDAGTSQATTNAYSTPIVTNVPPGTNITMYYWLAIPAGKAAGTYSASVYIKAVETATSSSESELKITEVYYDTVVAYEPDEYVRICNPTGGFIDLDGLYITDFEANSTFPNGYSIAANGCIIIAREGNAFAQQAGELPNFEMINTNASIPDMLVTGNIDTGHFANSGDELLLVNSNGDVIDTFIYGGSTYSGEGWTGSPVDLVDTQQFQAGYTNNELLVRNRKRNEEVEGQYLDTNSSADWDNNRMEDYVRYIGQSRFDYPEYFTHTGNITLFASPDTAYQEITNFIDNASSSLYIALYDWNNFHIMDSLLNALGRGVTVKVLLDGDTFNFAGVTDDNKYIAQQIEAAGGDVAYVVDTALQTDVRNRYASMHSKYAIADDKNVLISSDNWKYSGIPVDPTTGNRDWHVIIWNNPGLANYFTSVFNDDYDLAHKDIAEYCVLAEWCNPPGGFEPNRTIQTGNYTYPFASKNLAVSNMPLQVILSPDTSMFLDKSVIGMLKSAGSGSKIYWDEFYAWKCWGIPKADCTPETHPNVYLEEAINAARRGAIVRILLDSTDYNIDGTNDNQDTAAYINSKASSEGLDLGARLANYSITNYTKIHNKGMIVDNKVLISSINVNFHSTHLNREAGVIITNQEVADYFEDIFWYDWNGTMPG